MGEAVNKDFSKERHNIWFAVIKLTAINISD